MSNKVLLDKYRVTAEVIGRGSFAVVVGAFDIMTHERVAVKFSYEEKYVEPEY